MEIIYKLPVDIVEMITSQKINILLVEPEERIDSKNNGRRFIDILISKEDIKVKFEIMTFLNTDEWDFMDIQFKNCIYQDEPKDKMLELLSYLMNGNVFNEKTFFLKRDRWVVTDNDGKKIFYPEYIEKDILVK